MNLGEFLGPIPRSTLRDKDYPSMQRSSAKRSLRGRVIVRSALAIRNLFESSLDRVAPTTYLAGATLDTIALPINAAFK